MDGGRLDSRPLPPGVGTAAWPFGPEGADTAAGRVARRARVTEIIADRQPDVIIAGPVHSGAFLAALARAKPLVTVSWGTDLLVDADATAKFRFVTSYVLDHSDAVFGDCRAVREAVHRHSSLPDERIVTFPWGINLKRFRPGHSALALRSELGWTENEIFISTRSWEPVYAIDVLIRAFVLVRRALPASRLLLLGDGSLDAEVRSLLSDLQLGDKVHAPGRAPYGLLPDYFRSADVYVSSALSDGTSISLLEAMACGLPVVVSNSFGNPEWVVDGVNGALAKPGDAESLSVAMLSVVADREKRNRMSEANVETARRRANWERNFPALVALVEGLAEK